MRRSSRYVLTATAITLIGLAGAMEAEDSAPASPILQPKPPAIERPSAIRAVSPQTAARLAAATPPYRTPGAKPSAASREDIEDTPHNGIIRLPRYTVLAPKVRIPDDAHTLTPKAKLALALKANPGLRLFSFGPFNNDGIALEMLEEILQVQRRDRAVELMSLLPSNVAPGDGSSDIRSLVRDAANPRSSWTHMNPDHAPGN